MRVYVLIHDQNPDGDDHEDVVVSGVYRSLSMAKSRCIEIMHMLEAPEHLFANLDKFAEVTDGFGRSWTCPAMSGVGQFCIEEFDVL